MAASPVRQPTPTLQDNDPKLAEEIGASKNPDDSKFASLRNLVLQQPDWIVQSLREELDRLSKLKPPYTIEDLRPLKYAGPQTPDYKVMMGMLVNCVAGQKWPDALIEAGAATVFLDYILIGAPLIATFEPRSTFHLITPLSGLIQLIMSRSAAEIRSIKPRAYEALALFIRMMDDLPRECLDSPGWSNVVARILWVLLMKTDFPDNEHYDVQVIRRVLRYGFFLADNHATRKVWFSASFSSLGSQFNQEEVIVFLEKLGPGAVELVTSGYLTWLESSSTDENRHELGFLVVEPFLWLIKNEDTRFRDAFWDQVAIPLANYWWSCETDAKSLSIRHSLLLMFGASLQPDGTWTEIQVAQAATALASLDIAGVLAHLLYMSVYFEDWKVLSTCKSFVSVFADWISSHPALSASIRDIIKPSVELIFLSSLDKLGLVSTPSMCDMVDEDSDGSSDNDHNVSAIRCWLKFGMTLGLNEDELQEKRRKKSLKSSGLVGCSWKRCPLFHFPSEWPMLLCSDCFQVQYCADSICQKRDWHEGAHKDACLETAQSSHGL